MALERIVEEEKELSSDCSPSAQKINEKFERFRATLHKFFGQLRASHSYTAIGLEHMTSIGRHAMKDAEVGRRSLDFKTVFALFEVYGLPFFTLDKLMSESLGDGGSKFDSNLFEAMGHFSSLCDDDKDEILVAIYSKAYKQAIKSNDELMAETAKERFSRACQRRMERVLAMEEKV